MGLIETLWGTRPENSARTIIDRLEAKSTLTKRDEEALKQAQTLTRRLFLRRATTTVGGALALAAGIGAGIEATKGEEYDALQEDVYNFYLQNFKQLSQGDPESQKVLNFFIERRKAGVFKSGTVTAHEEGIAGTNFYTAIVDPKKNPDVRAAMHGAADYDHKTSPETLKLVKEALDPVWAGALIGHEALHVYQDLTGVEEGRENGFFLGEVDAYNFEFKLLDSATDGRFTKVAKIESDEIRPESIRGGLSSRNEYNLSALFYPAQSEFEQSLRIPTFLVALNFAAFDIRSSSPEQSLERKADYIEGVMTGNYPMVR